MSSLLLIRHGQASFFSENYDQLSHLGGEQAHALAQFWIRDGGTFDEIITGPRQRQTKTAEIVLDGYRAAGLDYPKPTEHSDFDEHHLEQLLRHHRQSLPLPELKEWGQRLDLTPSDSQRRFYHLLQTVADHWLNAGPGTEAVESWRAFKTRVLDGLTRILQREGHGRRVALFTSAGVIGVALQRALGCSDLQAMQMSWRVRNASITEFIFSGSRFTLDSFNGVPHLQDRRLWSHL